MRQRAYRLDDLFKSFQPQFIQHKRQKDGRGKNKEILVENKDPRIQECLPEIIQPKNEPEIVQTDPALKARYPEIGKGDQDSRQRDVMKYQIGQYRRRNH